MKKILLITLILVLNNCSGYQPIFSNKQFNYYISEITNINNDNISNQLIRSLGPYKIDNGKQKIALELKSEINENVVSRDTKGDPLVYEIKIEVEMNIINNEKDKKLRFIENFSFNNQSNKFELSQYKNNLIENLTERIFEKILLSLQTI